MGAGLVLVDEGRQVFPTLTVAENLTMGAHRRRLPARALAGECERAYELFPRLAERRDQLAGKLSGGEQQMLVIARALLAEPELMMIDEASMGLAPNISEFVFETIGRLAADGLTVLVTEQYVRLALEVAGQGLRPQAGPHRRGGQRGGAAPLRPRRGLVPGGCVMSAWSRRRPGWRR